MIVMALVVSACMLTSLHGKPRMVCIEDMPIFTPTEQTLSACQQHMEKRIAQWHADAEATHLDWQNEHFACKFIDNDEDDDEPKGVIR